jgi:hypothetical protein
VANTVRLMFDQPLIDRGSEVPVAFSSDNPPLEVIHGVASDHNSLDDDTFLSDEPKGSFLKSSRM